MDIKELKSKIENHESLSLPIVFLAEDFFLPYQYVKEIPNIVFVDEVETNSSLFSTLDNSVKVLSTATLSEAVAGNYIIICKKIEKNTELQMEVVEFPKLEDWMIEDFVNSKLSGVSKANIDYLINICKHDIYRLNHEIDKLLLFDEIFRNIQFEKFKEDGVFNDLSQYNIFSMSNALLNKNISEISNILTHLQTAPEVVDIEPLGLYTIMYNNISNMIKVGCTQNPTIENTGLKANQIWAIKNNSTFSKNTLISLFKTLTSIDSGFKTGSFPIEILRDYIILKFCLT